MECSLYLAPSTIPNAGLGVFTAHALHRGDVVSSNDVAIPILDLRWHNGAEGDQDNFTNPFEDYVWAGHAMGLSREGGDFDGITLFWPGLDSIVNSFPSLVNLERALPEYDPDLGGSLHRSRNPAMGSFTPYVGTKSYVKHFVPVGGELFKDYGDDWFQRRKLNISVISIVPQAEQILEKFSWKIPTRWQPYVYDLILDWKQIWDQPPMLHAIPRSWANVEPMMEQLHLKNSTVSQELRKSYQDSATRSLEWLKEHGSCLDRIETAPSTLPGAGRGGFAKQSFAMGDIITTSPMMHMANKTILHMYNIGLDLHDPSKFVQQEKIGSQLVTNYCFSHPQTSLALCPYGAGVNSINHSREMANVRLQWPITEIMNHHLSMLTTPPEQWSTFLRPQLALDYVATRTIAAGDELFLDYGFSWQEAWEQHRRNWYLSELVQPVPVGGGYVSASMWNRQHRHNDTLWTDEEIKDVPLRQKHSFLQLRCHSGLLNTPHARYARLKWKGDWADARFDPEYGRPCRVVSRHDDGLYDMVIQAVVNEETWQKEEILRKNVPRRLIRWFDQPQTTDLHLHLAFRHSPGLPDELVSQEWRNVPETESAKRVPRSVEDVPVTKNSQSSLKHFENEAPLVSAGTAANANMNDASPEMKARSGATLNPDVCPTVN